MGTIGFYLVYSLIWGLTCLPLPVLFVFSDFTYYILYYVISYRRKVVAVNLRNAFPEKSERELREIEKKYYRHMADLFIETFKLINISESEHRRRFKVENPEILDDFLKKKRDVVAITGHYNNWEWSSILSTYTGLQLIPVYKPLSNKHFDNMMRNTRARYKAVPTPMSNVLRELNRFRKEGTTILIGMAGDQTPAKKEINYWTTFLNQDTPVFSGSGKIASKYEMAVVFLNVQKVRRGYYSLTVETLFDQATGIPENTITEAHVRRLEQIIREKPEYWLWSHRRWKHKKPETVN
jgi:Kdo2-lipid IVA lauroyltransferase/acyltransferase